MAEEKHHHLFRSNNKGEQVVYYKEEKYQKHLDHLGKLNAGVASNYALIKKELVATTAVVPRGFANQEYRENKEVKNEEEEVNGKKHHHLFYHHRGKKEAIDYKEDEKHRKHLERFGKLGVDVVGAYAMHDEYGEQKDLDHAHIHKVKAEIGATPTLGVEGFTFHEYHENKQAKQEDEEAYGKKKHHHPFYHHKKSGEAIDYKKPEEHHNHLEHFAQVGVGVSGACDLQEKYKIKKDLDHVHIHKIKTQIGAVAVVGAEEFTFHEHHEKKISKESEEAIDYKEGKHRKHLEHVDKLGVIVVGANTLHEEKKDLQHLYNQKVKAEIAAATTVGAERLAFYEHHEKKEANKEEILHGKMHYLHFYHQKEGGNVVDYKEKHRKHFENFGGLDAITAGAYALYDKPEEMKDVEHVHNHRIKEETTTATAIEAERFAFHEHHEQKEANKEDEEANGKKHHHYFYHHKENIKAFDFKEEDKCYNHPKHLGKLGAGVAGAYYMHGKHEEHKDLKHAHNHEVKVEVAVAGAVEAERFAFHEDNEKKEAKKEDEVHREENYHYFYHHKEGEDVVNNMEEEKQHKYFEHLDELGVVAGAYTLKDKEKKDLEHTQNHMVKVDAAAVGAERFAFDEKKETKKEEVVRGNKQYHHFYHHKEGRSVADYKEEKHHRHFENLGKLDAITVDTYALHDKHEERKQSEHAHLKIKEKITTTNIVGAEGNASHERHDNKEFKKEDEEAHGKKHHHLFYHHKVEDKHHNYSEHLGELGNGAASAYSLHGKHEENKDLEHTNNHNVKVEIVAVSAVGAEGLALHEHHEKKGAKKEDEAYGEKSYHHFYHHKEGEDVVDYEEEKQHKYVEHLDELGVAAAGAYVLHEKYEEKKDLEHAHSHKVKAEIVTSAVVGDERFVFHEHHNKNEAKKVDEVVHGKKQYKDFQNLDGRDVVVASADNLHEKHEENKDSENACNYMIKKELATAAIVGVEGFALHEDLKKKEFKKEDEEAYGKKYYHKENEEAIGYKEEEKHHDHLEHLSKLGVGVAGTYDMQNKHDKKKDSEHNYKYKIKDEIVTATAVGAEGFAFQEHHEKKKVKKENEGASYNNYMTKKEQATTAILGVDGFAFYEDHKKKEVKKEDEAYGKHYHKKSEEAIDYKEKEMHYDHLEHLSKIGVGVSGTYVMHDKHKEKNNSEHAYNYKIKEEIVTAAAVGAEGFAFQEHHEKKEVKKENEGASYNSYKIKKELATATIVRIEEVAFHEDYEKKEVEKEDEEAYGKKCYHNENEEAIGYKEEEKHHDHLEHLSKLSVGAVATYAMHEEKKDSKHAYNYKIKEEIVTAAAIGAEGSVFQEHHEKNEEKKENEEDSHDSYMIKKELATVGIDGFSFDEDLEKKEVNKKDEEAYGKKYYPKESEEAIGCKEEEMHHDQLEHLSELGVGVVGTYAVDKHGEKNNSEHAYNYKIEEEIVTATMTGAEGFSFQEHHDKKEVKKENEGANYNNYMIKKDQATTTIVGVEGFAFHEDHEKKEDKKEDEAANGKKHYHKESKEAIGYKQEKVHRDHLEHLSKLSVGVADTYAMHYKNEEKKDSEHAYNYKIKEEIATAVAIGVEGSAFQEHHEKKEIKKEIEGASYKTNMIKTEQATIGVVGFAFHEDLEKKELKKENEEVYGKNHYHKESEKAIGCKEEEMHHDHLEYLSIPGVAVAGASAMQDKHEEQNDSEHAYNYKIEEQIVTATMTGAKGFSFQEQHEKKEVKKENEGASYNNYIIKKELAIATIIGVEGFAFHEDHEKKENKKEDEEANGKKHCHKESEEAIGYKEEKMNLDHLEHLSKLSHDKNEKKKDSEHAYNYKIKEEIVTAATVGVEGSVLQEHYEKKEVKKEIERAIYNTNMIKTELATIGVEGFAFHEDLEKKEVKTEDEEAYGKKYYHKEIEKNIGCKEEEMHHDHLEHLSKLGVAIVGTSAMDKHVEKNNSEHAYNYKMEEEIVTTTTTGAEGFSFQEHYDKKEVKKENEGTSYNNYMIKEELATTTIVGVEGFAFHEDHEKKEDNKEDEEANGKKHCHKESKEAIGYKEEKMHQDHLEHLSKLSVGVAGTHAMHDKNEEKKDSEHTYNLKIKEEIITAATVGLEGSVFQEHHEKNEAKRENEGASYNTNMIKTELATTATVGVEGFAFHKDLKKKEVKTEDEEACGKKYYDKESEKGIGCKEEEMHCDHFEHLSKLGVAIDGTYAMHDKCEEKKDSKNAYIHKIKEEIVTVAAVGAKGSALQEHHEKKEVKKENEGASYNSYMIKKELATVGVEGFAFHEDLEKKEVKKENEEAYGKKHYPKESIEAIGCNEEEMHHGHLEHLSKLGVSIANTYAMCDKHEEELDSEHAYNYKIKEEIVTTAAVGVEGYALQEHHKKKELKKEIEGASYNTYMIKKELATVSTIGVDGFTFNEDLEKQEVKKEDEESYGKKHYPKESEEAIGCKEEEMHHDQLEHFSKLAVGVHEEKKDSKYAHNYKIKEEIVTAAAVGAEGSAFQEHHEKKEVKKENEGASYNCYMIKKGLATVGVNGFAFNEDLEKKEPKKEDEEGYEKMHYNKESEEAIGYKEEMHHNQLKHYSKLGVGVVETYAMRDKHEEKKDSEHTYNYKINEEIVTLATVGAEGSAFQEHHEKKEVKKENEGGSHNNYMIKKELATASTVGVVRFAFHEDLEKKEVKKEDEEAYGKKYYHNESEEAIGYKEEEKHHDHLEHLSKLSVGAAATYAMHEEKKDSKHAYNYKIKGEIVTVTAIGAEGYIFQEHHVKNEEKKENEEDSYNSYIIKKELATVGIDGFSFDEDLEKKEVKKDDEEAYGKKYYPKENEEAIGCKEEEMHNDQPEHLSELGVGVVGTYAVQDKHREKNNSEHAYNYKIEEEIVTATTTGAEGFSFQEHHDKKEVKKENEGANYNNYMIKKDQATTTIVGVEGFAFHEDHEKKEDKKEDEEANGKKHCHKESEEAIGYKQEKMHHDHLEHLSKLSVGVADTYAMHYKNEEKKDSEHAYNLKIKEEIITAATVGLEGSAFQGHREKNEAKRENEGAIYNTNMIKTELATTATVGVERFAFHEDLKKKEVKTEDEAAYGKKYYHKESEKGIGCKEEEMPHDHFENLSKLGVAIDDTYAMHDKCEEKKDSKNAYIHKINEDIVTVAVVGAEGSAFQEHHEKKEVKKENEGASYNSYMIKKELATVRVEGFAFHEDLEKKEVKKENEEAYGKKHYPKKSKEAIGCKEKEMHHDHLEHLSKLGVSVANTYAMRDKHEEELDSEHAYNYKIKEEIVTTTAVRVEGYAFQEHHEKKELKKEIEGASYNTYMIKKELATIGVDGFTFDEDLEKQEVKQEDEEAYGKKHYPKESEEAIGCKEEEMHHDQLEHFSKLAVGVANTYAMHEENKGSKCANNYKIKEEIVTVAGAEGSAFQEHHEKIEVKKENEGASYNCYMIKKELASEGVNGFAFNEDLEKKELKKEDEEAYGKMHYHKESEEAIGYKEEMHYNQLEHFSKLGVGVVETYAMHDKHEEKQDSKHTYNYKIKEEIVTVATVGAEGSAFQEHHEKKEVKKENEGGSHNNYMIKKELATASTVGVVRFAFREDLEKKEVKKEDEEAYGKKHYHMESEETIGYKEEEMHHDHPEHLPKLGVGVADAGAYSLYGKQEENKDLERAHNHKVKVEIDVAGAIGAEGFAFHEHHEKKGAKKDDELYRDKHYHYFYHDKERKNDVYYKKEKHHKYFEHLRELGVVAADTYALHGNHEEKIDLEHAHSYKVNAEIATTTMLGAKGFTFHGHHVKKEAKKDDEVEHENKQYHHFYLHKEGENVVDYKEEKHQKHFQNFAKPDAVEAGAYTLYEKHKENRVSENSYSYMIKKELATAAAIGTERFAFHEYHGKKEVKDEDEATRKKHHNKESEEAIGYKKVEQHHNHLEHLGKLDAGVTSIYSLHDKYKENKYLEYGHNHKIKEEIVTTDTVGAKGFALQEHHEKKEIKKEDEELHEKKHHHLFYHFKQSEKAIDYKEEDKHHNNPEHLGVGVTVAGTYSLYGKHEEYEGLEHAHGSKVKANIAVTTMVGAERFAFDEYNEKNGAKKEDEMHGEKYYRHFYHHNEGKNLVDYREKVKHHKDLEHLGELGVVPANTYALYEKYEAKKDQEHAYSYKGKEEIDVAAAVRAKRFAFHEYHAKKEDKKEDKEEKQHYHLFYHCKENEEAIDYKEEKHHKYLEHLGKLAVGIPNAYSLHTENKDSEHAHNHKVIAKDTTNIIGAEGFAFHAYHENKGAKKEDKELHGKNYYHNFYYQNEGKDVDHKKEMYHKYFEHLA
ncbi:uncharacterized protein LOC110607907 isoform X5 [Manihot esculenta]|uniref:uncharacterized protein LOC110607907 isoform X5 n=1 Tax=Manihot esculenta TaxID=3983 RepID=UPI000B5D430C|nr:uncharacterized protein LOC110607907 isoform X5 [Manihot esculenta]